LTLEETNDVLQALFHAPFVFSEVASGGSRFEIGVSSALGGAASPASNAATRQVRRLCNSESAII
jgi:hypothetical protein